jgi:hypothetical protein
VWLLGKPVKESRVEILETIVNAYTNRTNFDYVRLIDQAAAACQKGEPEVLDCYLKATCRLKDQQGVLFATLLNSLNFNTPHAYEIYRKIFETAADAHFVFPINKVPVTDLICEAEKKDDPMMLVFLNVLEVANLYEHPRLIAKIFKKDNKDDLLNWGFFKFNLLIINAGKVSTELLLEIIKGISSLKIFPKIMLDVKATILKYRHENQSQVKGDSHFQEVMKLMGIPAELTR